MKNPGHDINHHSIEELDEQFGKLSPGDINRRDLLLQGAKILGGLAAGSYILTRSGNSLASVQWTDEEDEGKSSKEKTSSKSSGKSTVVQVQDAKSVDSSGDGKDGPVHDMVTKAIIQLTGESDAARAWRRIAQNGQRVGIKVNCIAGRGLSTQVPVVMAIVDGLKLAGVLERDIIIWDRTDRELKNAGYTLQTDADALKCYGTSGSSAYEEKENNINGTKFKLSKILTDEIDVLINVPIMKNHGSAGVSLAMKNHYGSHNNPGNHHGNNCDPYIADICSHPAIKDKTRLIVCDGLRAQCNGGPGNKPRWQWHPGIVLMSTDPVAHDRIGSDIMEQRRTEIGLGGFGNSHKHIITASKLGLGNENRNLIDLQKIVVN